MKALMLHGPDDVRLQEVPDPTPGPGELVVAVEVALTCATDAKMLARASHPALPPLPAPFGHEASGIVHAVGAGVRGLREGDAVVLVNSCPCGACEWCRRDRAGLCERITYLSGAYAELLSVPAAIVARNVLPRPPGMRPEIAAMVEPVACAVRGAQRSGARAGDTVIVLGGGPQGQVITAMLAARGCAVVLCDPHATRRALALRMGAAAVLAPDNEAAVRDLTPGGLGAHVVFAAVGTVPAWQQALRLVRRGGEVNLHGGTAGDTLLSTPAAPLHYGEVTVQASYHHDPHAVRVAVDVLTFTDRPFEELLGRRIGLSDVPAALRAGGDKHIVHPRRGARD